jgi:environmental stress-induced protein Ves
MQTQHADIRVIAANDYQRVRWKNGLGWTREIVRFPDNDAWIWRLSIAEIERDAVFSRFPGVDRELVLLSGNGLRLRFESGEVRELLPPHASIRFEGEAAVTGELIDGSTTDFNLMWRRDAVDAQLWHRPMVGAMVVFIDPGETWAVHMLSGHAGFDERDDGAGLQAGDTALLQARDTRRRCVLEGAGEALVIRLRSRTSRQSRDGLI